MNQRCFGCGERFPLDQVVYTCPKCAAVIEVALDAPPDGVRALSGKGVWRYAPWLPVAANRAVTLGEGATGLHELPRLGQSLGVGSLFLKAEGENPTGSFKDRGMTVGMSQALVLGARAVACASTGNTSASMAAYAARCGLPAIVLIPGGKIAMGKLAQAIVHGARIVQIRGNFDDAMRIVHELSTSTQAVYLLNSINPFRLEGQKTLAFEVCEALGGPPDVLVAPLGNAGNISAIWKGFREFHAAGLIDRLPKLIAVQAEGAAPLARYLAGELAEPRVSDPETVATAIRIGAPLSWQKAVAALQESGGFAATVSDDEILAAQRQLASTEGLFIEPASAAPIAFLNKHKLKAERVVCVATGHGLKDPDAILRHTPQLEQAEPTLEALRRLLEV